MKPSEDVAIFWDYENCPVSSNASGYAIVNNITTLAHPFGNIKVFKAYLEVPEQLPLSRFISLRSELQSSGVSLIDCPHNGRKEVADKMLIVDLLAYAIDTPSPATILLITGDRDFAYALSILKLRGYRIILVTLPNAHASLTAQASMRYDWQNDIVNPLPAPNREAPSTSRPQYKSNLSYDGPSPDTPPQRWRNLPSNTPGLEGCEETDFNRNLRKTPQKPSLVPSSSRFGERVHTRTDSRGEQAICGPSFSPSKKRSKTSGYQSETRSAVTLGAPVAASLERPLQIVPATPSESQTRYEAAKGGSQASAEAQYPDVFDDESSDMEFSSTENSPAIGPTKDLSSCDVDIYPSTIANLSGLTLSGPHSASKPHNFAPYPTNPSQEIHIYPSSLEWESDMRATRTPEPLHTPNMKPGLATTPTAEASAMPLVVPPAFASLVQILQDHRAKGYFISYRSIVAGRIFKGGNGGATFKKAGAHSYKHYLSLAEKAGLIEQDGQGQAAWVRLTPAWYNATVEL